MLRICICLLMTLRTPTYTLFPYTTLFRSQVLGQEERHALRAQRRSQHEGAQAGPRPGAMPRFLLELAPSGFEDRKSTRLNSSHSQISYAVFCLKKKNNNIASYQEHKAHDA